MDKSQIVAAKNEFERIWHSEQLTVDYKDKLLQSLAFVYKEHSPEFAYYFTLNELFGDKIDDGVERFERENNDFKDSKIWSMLFDFQKEAVQYAIQKINKYNGCIIADSVGLGKTFEALAVMKYYSDRQDNILVLTPAKLYNNWDSYRDNDYSDNPLVDDNIRTCLHKKCVRIFEHNFVADKAKIRRRAVARQGFLTQSAAKFAEKTCAYACEDRFLNTRYFVIPTFHVMREHHEAVLTLPVWIGAGLTLS